MSPPYAALDVRRVLVSWGDGGGHKPDLELSQKRFFGMRPSMALWDTLRATTLVPVKQRQTTKACGGSRRPSIRPEEPRAMNPWPRFPVLLSYSYKKKSIERVQNKSPASAAHHEYTPECVGGGGVEAYVRA